MKDITAKEANLFTKKPMNLGKKYKKNLMKQIWAAATEGYFQTCINIDGPSEAEAVGFYLEKLGYKISRRSSKTMIIKWEDENNE